MQFHSITNISENNREVTVIEHPRNPLNKKENKMTAQQGIKERIRKYVN